jgi:hypothetical protein
MHRWNRIAWLLTCALGLSGCASNGKAVKPPAECPQPQPVPASLMQSPNYVERVSAEFFEPSGNVRRK